MTGLLIAGIVVAVASLLALFFQRRIVPDGTGRGPLVAVAMILLVISVVLVIAILTAR